MSTKETKDRLMEKLEAIKGLAEESQTLLSDATPDVGRLLALLQAQSGLQQALLEKLLEVMEPVPSQKEKDLSDTYQQAVQELLEYFRERVRLAGKRADAAALEHLRKE